MRAPLAAALVLLGVVPAEGANGGSDGPMRPEQTEVWEPVPAIVTTGDSFVEPPSDAIVLFDGSGLSQWSAESGGVPLWDSSGESMTVKPGTGNIVTKDSFGSVQLYLEWRTPREIDGDGQDRGNSGIFLQSRYELQVLDSYENTTYVNGMAGSIYKQAIPLVNAARKPGAWQSYNIIYRAPDFDADGTLKSPARFTVFWNGVLVHNDVELQGSTVYVGHPKYEPHGDAPLLLQDHGSPVSYRNIWIRRLPD